ncbi:NAD(P)/FAD-dependent oxidoreductase [Aminobacter aminovorans]|uniref:flavin-containing monooxygenase n=1 Tax=Aminobacter TaxID=31988 RepID=UPI002861E3D7|nr:NAD(P)/FAD-dependent oxidoreductase [Aminobacter aminovorans]MDR7225197.1 4-hydroxyacetophenone monooxygenase [Aminobacter aminovorans]
MAGTPKLKAAIPVGLDEFYVIHPIMADGGEIERAVADADLPALLAALAMITEDDALISDDLRPPTPKMGASIKPQGGMSMEAQVKARRLATQALIAYRDRGSPEPSAPDGERLDRIMRFLTKDAGPEYLPLLRHELALPRDMGEPDWRLGDIAPGRDFSVAVIGAGLSGVAAAHRLQQAGVPYTVFERKPDVGGVWWANSYPGCRLDTPNFAYSLSFAQKQDWPQQFSRQPEIQAYISRVSDLAGLRDNIRFNAEVLSLLWQEDSATWLVTTRSETGEVEERGFNAIITAVGQLSQPSIPDIAGLEGFAGSYFHSAEWPADLDVSGKRVAVVGTGASAYQIVPSIVDSVASLHVFQRNPPWMLPTPSYHDDIRPGMAWLLRHVPYYGRWFRFWQFWIAAEGRLPLVEVDDGWQHPISVGQANEGLRQECMAHLEAQLKDRPDLLEKLTPTYPPGAKRMLRDNGVWTSALKQPHAHLVTERIDRVEGSTIVTANGERREVDVIVFATGFLASDYLHPMEVKGCEGRDIHEWWAGDCRAHLGITVPGFPNLFMSGGPNTGVVVNGSAIFSAECAVEYALSAIGQTLSSGHDAIDCRPEPFQAFNERVDAENLRKAWGVAKTSSWYRNATGRASQTWPFSLLEYWRLTERADLGEYDFVDAAPRRQPDSQP